MIDTTSALNDLRWLRNIAQRALNSLDGIELDVSDAERIERISFGAMFADEYRESLSATSILVLGDLFEHPDPTFHPDEEEDENPAECACCFLRSLHCQVFSPLVENRLADLSASERGLVDRAGPYRFPAESLPEQRLECNDKHLLATAAGQTRTRTWKPAVGSLLDGCEVEFMEDGAVVLRVPTRPSPLIATNYRLLIKAPASNQDEYIAVEPDAGSDSDRAAFKRPDGHSGDRPEGIFIHKDALVS